MKIRIKGNSIRLRLSKSDVHKLCTEKSVSEKTQFLNSHFEYHLIAKDINALEADFKENAITVYFPSKETSTWYDSELITYKNDMKLDHDVTLTIIVEKDFVCLDHSDEDQSDNYANPNKTC